MGKTLIEVLEESNIRLIPRGERWVASCPLPEHGGADSTPSFTVYPNMTYWCFGCKTWGDAIRFLVDYKGMTERAALEYAGVEARRSRPIKHVIKITHRAKVYSFLYDVADAYHDFLLKTPGAIHYLHSRGIEDATINKYKVGFTDVGLVDPQTDEAYQLAKASGIITEATDSYEWWETLGHRITIPNIPAAGQCDFIIGRTVTKSTVKYLGLTIPKPIYGLIEASDSPVWFLVEGHFDWLLLKQWGYPAILSGGTNIPESNLHALRSRKIIIVPDNDDVGLDSAKALTKKLPDSAVLDYKQYGVKDVGELGALNDGAEKFDYEVRRQGDWIPYLSPTTLTKWFPRLSP